MFKKVSKYSREEILDLKPRPNKGVSWERYATGEIAVKISYNIRGKSKIFYALALKPKERKIILDNIGSFVWTLIDGNHTVKEIILKLSERFKLSKREAEASLLVFLSKLQKKGAITF